MEVGDFAADGWLVSTPPRQVYGSTYLDIRLVLPTGDSWAGGLFVEPASVCDTKPDGGPPWQLDCEVGRFSRGRLGFHLTDPEIPFQTFDIPGPYRLEAEGTESLQFTVAPGPMESLIRFPGQFVFSQETWIQGSAEAMRRPVSFVGAFMARVHGDVLARRALR